MESSLKKKSLFCKAMFFGGLSALGGGLSFLILSTASQSLIKVSSGDAMSVANTYIVYTTLIFVIMTIMITGASIYLSQQNSLTKDLVMRSVAEELKIKIASDSQQAQDLMKSALSNPDVIRLIEERIQFQVDKLVKNSAEQNDVEVTAVKNAIHQQFSKEEKLK